MTQDINKIKLSLKNCEEVSLPYKFEPRTWIKYITVKGEDEVFYEGGIYAGMGDHKLFVINKGKRLTVPTYIRSDDGEIIYQSRFFIDTKKTNTCEDKHIEITKTVKAQQAVIKKTSIQIKMLEERNQALQSENYDLLGSLDTKEKELQELLEKEKKYKLLLSQFM